jgi:hypothetical protein
VLNRREELQPGAREQLGVMESYEVGGATLSKDELSLSVTRRCEERTRVEIQTVQVETRSYDTELAWIGVASVAGAGLTGAIVLASEAEDECFFDNTGSCEADYDDAYMVAGITAGVTGVAALITVLYEGESESSSVIRSDWQEETVAASCGSSMATGVASIIAPGLELTGELRADGKAVFSVEQAPSALWTSDELQLQLPRSESWTPFRLPESVQATGLQRGGQSQLSLELSFDDRRGNQDGVLDAGESGRIHYVLSNHGNTSGQDLQLELSLMDANGVSLLLPKQGVAAVAAGDRVEGNFDVEAALTVDSHSFVVEASLHSAGKVVAVQRLRMSARKAGESERVFVMFSPNDKEQGLLEAGSKRVQSVLTSSRRYKIVSDADTQTRIHQIVDEGGGSIEQRRALVLEAARQENISKVIILEVLPIRGSAAQLSLAVHSTLSGDRIYLKDAAADLDDVMGALSVFDELATAFLAWDGQ